MAVFYEFQDTDRKYGGGDDGMDPKQILLIALYGMYGITRVLRAEISDLPPQFIEYVPEIEAEAGVLESLVDQSLKELDDNYLKTSSMKFPIVKAAMKIDRYGIRGGIKEYINSYENYYDMIYGLRSYPRSVDRVMYKLRTVQGRLERIMRVV